MTKHTPTLGDRVTNPDTKKESVITRMVPTRFGILANLDGNNMRAWLPHTLKAITKSTEGQI